MSGTINQRAPGDDRAKVQGAASASARIGYGKRAGWAL
jgi:hypothetical protein